ncbi:MAG: hypothetical protein ABIP13_01245 [Tepidiformaceae bacterium]
MIRSSADTLGLRVGAELVDRWHEVRLADLVADRFGEQLGGRELLHPETRVMLADCRPRMQAMHHELAGDSGPMNYGFELSEPSRAGFDHLLNLLISRKVTA